MDTLSTAEYRDLVACRMPEAGRNGWQERVRRIAMLEARTTPEGAWTVYHAWQSRHSAAGFPDVFAWRFECDATPTARRAYLPNGVPASEWVPVRLRIVIAELKRVGGKPTPEQERWLVMWRWLALMLSRFPLLRLHVAVWTPLDEAEVRRVFLERAG